MRLAMLAFVVACGPAQYDFVAPELPVANPATGAALVDASAVAVDGLTKHRWTSFTPAEACFLSRLNDFRAEDVVPARPFLLLGFRDASEPLDKVPTLASSRVTVKDSGHEAVATDERSFQLVHVDVEVCFANAGRVVTPATRYVVLRVPYSTQSEAIGSAGSRDGVWRLTK